MQLPNKKEIRQLGLNCVNFNLKKAARETTGYFDRALKPLGIKSTQFSILMAACYLEQSSMRELADMLGLDRTTLTKNLKPLLRDNYLQIARGQDRRRQIISLTTAGADLFLAALPLRQKAHEQIIERIGEADYRILLKALRHYEHKVKGELKES